MSYSITLFLDRFLWTVTVCFWGGGAQWLSGRVLDSRPRGCGFEPNRRHCVVSLSKNINPSLVLVQPRKTRLFITERLLMGREELNQTNNHGFYYNDYLLLLLFLFHLINSFHNVLKINTNFFFYLFLSFIYNFKAIYIQTMHRSACMYLIVKISFFLEIPINLYSFTKSILINYNYKTYPSGGNICSDHTARLHILISTF